MKKGILAIGMCLGLVACEKAIMQPKGVSTNPQENLDYLWEQCDEKYSYFELKGVDWDQVKVKYSSKVYDGMYDDSLFTVMGEMLSELKDDHTNLISPFNVSRFGVKYQAQDNFDWRIIEDHYLSTDYYISGPFSHDYLANNRIGYVRFPAFTGTIDDFNLDFVLTRYQFTEGLIIDMRENGGGAVSDVFKILSRLVDQPTTVYYSRIKSGKGHNEFSQPEAAVVQPSNAVRYLKPIIMLVDRGTYSAGSFTSLATKAIPNVQLMGDTTGGGLGLPNGGQLPNGWTYRFSITQTLDLNMKPDYEMGVPPDHYVLFDWNNRNRDEILDAAIRELL